MSVKIEHDGHTYSASALVSEAKRYTASANRNMELLSQTTTEQTRVSLVNTAMRNAATALSAAALRTSVPATATAHEAHSNAEKAVRRALEWAKDNNSFGILLEAFRKKTTERIALEYLPPLTVLHELAERHGWRRRGGDLGLILSRTGDHTITVSLSRSGEITEVEINKIKFFTTGSSLHKLTQVAELLKKGTPLPKPARTARHDIDEAAIEHGWHRSGGPVSGMVFTRPGSPVVKVRVTGSGRVAKWSVDNDEQTPDATPEEKLAAILNVLSVPRTKPVEEFGRDAETEDRDIAGRAFVRDDLTKIEAADLERDHVFQVHVYRRDGKPGPVRVRVLTEPTRTDDLIDPNERLAFWCRRDDDDSEGWVHYRERDAVWVEPA